MSTDSVGDAAGRSSVTNPAHGQSPASVNDRHLSLEQVFGFLALSLVAIGCFFVLRPFITAILWAIVLAFSTWPIYRKIQKLCAKRATLSAAVMTLLIAIAIVLPLVAIGARVAEVGQDYVDDVRRILQNGLPNLPLWVSKIPMVGAIIMDFWSGIAGSSSALLDLIQPYLGLLRDIAIASGFAIGSGVVEISLSLLVVFFLFRDGMDAAARATAVMEKIVGRRAQDLLRIALGTVQGVVHGLIGTALVQGILAGIGFFVAGVPSPLVLGFLCFILSLFPVGAPLIWIPATIWLFQEGQLGWAIFMGLWGAFVVSSVDNFLKPYLISRGTRQPFILVFMGVVGGALTFGFVGIFIGPTLLAVGHALIEQWLKGTSSFGPSKDQRPRQSNAQV